MRVVCFLMILSLSLAGCVAGHDQASAEATAHKQLEALWKLDRSTFEETMADPFFDFGSSLWIETPSEGMIEFFESAETRRSMQQIDDWRDLVDLESVRTGTIEELGSEASFFTDSKFGAQEGDIVWFAMPSDESPLFDGWGGVYREIDGAWMHVGGD